jgi:hypothetical protein
VNAAAGRERLEPEPVGVAGHHRIAEHPDGGRRDVILRACDRSGRDQRLRG